MQGMKVTILTCVGNEKETVDVRDPNWKAALESYRQFADEIIVVDGSCTLKSDGDMKVVHYHWPWDWSWEELPKHLNKGLEAASGDWVIRCDIDYIFHENDIPLIRKRLAMRGLVPIGSFHKNSLVTRDGYYVKGSVPMAINKGQFSDRIQFGKADNMRTDLCYPIYVKDISEDGVPYGRFREEAIVPVRLPFYNYDYTFKTKEETRREFWRFSQAYYRYFKEWRFGSTEEESFDYFVNMMKMRLTRNIRPITIEEHPVFIREAVRNMTPEMFGYNGWGMLS
jgi:glycosyltransferase involved in cell wall biosynthesis